MLHVSTQKLIIKLCELTAQGDVQWREGVEGAVVFETEGYAVEISGQPPRLRVLTSDGSELERVDADTLGATPWPDGEGSFADRISTMAVQAKRLARGTDHAISRILSSLSTPAAAAAERLPETGADAHAESIVGGAESEAAMAAAVSDMEIHLHQAPLEGGAAEDTPTPVIAAAAAVEAAAPENAPGETLTPPSDAVAIPETPAQPVHAPAEHFKRSHEMFGRTRSFAIAGRTHHRPTPEARPISSLGKITASGLLMTGAPAASSMPADVRPADPEHEQIVQPTVTTEAAQIAAPRTAPTPTSPDAYKPWV